MNARLEAIPFAVEPDSKGDIVEQKPVFAQSALEAITGALADTDEGLTGSEIGHLLETCRMHDPSPTITKRHRLYNAFTMSQNTRRDRRAILAFIWHAMKPERHVREPERFEPLRANLNRALSFGGLAVDTAGALVSAERVHTLSEASRRANELRDDLTARGVHGDVLQFCRAELVVDDYFHAVLEATKSIAAKIREKAGLVEDGAALVDAALCGRHPRLSVNSLRSRSARRAARLRQSRQRCLRHVPESHGARGPHTVEDEQG